MEHSPFLNKEYRVKKNWLWLVSEYVHSRTILYRLYYVAFACLACNSDGCN